MIGPPDVVPLAALPDRVEVHEVGPRDGLQSEPVVVPTAAKAEFIAGLAAAGLSRIEVASFVRPDRVPALADAEQLLEMLDRPAGVAYTALVPNVRGLERALAHRLDQVAIFASATETFSLANLGRSIGASIEMFAPVVEAARREGIRVRAYLSMCFGDPWEGRVPVAAVVKVALALMELGCDELSLGDTIGVATPGQVVALIEALADAGVGVGHLAVHFHDTYGQALANTLVALQHGVRRVDSSAGGIGGCPFAKSATGNLATEDLVWQLDGLGIETGIDLRRLVALSRSMAMALGRPSPSRVVNALGKENADDAVRDG